MGVRSLCKVQTFFGLSDEDTANINLLDIICTCLLALCPLLQHYKAPFMDASSVLMVLLLPYLGFRLLQKKVWYFGAVLPLLVFSVYEIVNHGTGIMEIAREALLIVFFIAAASGAIRLKLFIRIVIAIAAVASGLIVLQYLCYYIFGFHLQLVATPLLEESAAQWIPLVQTGRIAVTGEATGFYRPSAFFLEPSHFTIFCFPALALVLLAPGTNRDRTRLLPAAVLSLGILLTTSGMGIAIVLGLWMLFAFRLLLGEGDLREKLANLLKPKSLIVLASILVFLVIAYFAVPLFRMSVNRIFFSTSGGNNAIMGRMGTGIKAIKQLSGWEFWFGKSNWGNVHNWNMSGFFYTFYTQGFIGMLLSYVFYVRTLFKTKAPYFWIAAVLIGLSLVTVHTHAAFYMMFYSLILLAGYPEEKNSRFAVTNKGDVLLDRLRKSVRDAHSH